MTYILPTIFGLAFLIVGIQAILAAGAGTIPADTILSDNLNENSSKIIWMYVKGAGLTSLGFVMIVLLVWKSSFFRRKFRQKNKTTISKY